MLEVDPSPLFCEQPVNLRNIRKGESGKKSPSSRQLQHNSSSIPGHESDAKGHPDGNNKQSHRDAKRRNSSSRRDTHCGSPQQTSPRDAQRMEKSHQSSSTQLTLSTDALDDLTPGLILKSPKISSPKSCQDHNNNNKDNGHIHPTSAATNHDPSSPTRREKRSTSRIRARQEESPSKKVPPQEPSTPTRSHRSSTRSTRSQLHDSPNSIKSIPSLPSGDSCARSIPRSEKRITAKKDEQTDCKANEVATVSRSHKNSSRTRNHKTKSNHHDTKGKPSPRKELANTKRKDDEEIAIENRPKVDDHDDKENSHKMSGNVGAYENTAMRPDHQENHEMQSRSGVATRKIPEKYMESTRSLQELATAVSPTEHCPKEFNRKKRQTSSSPGKVRRSNKVLEGGSVEDLFASSPGRVKKSNKVVDGDSVRDWSAFFKSWLDSVDEDVVSSVEPSSTRNLTTSPSPTSKRKHHHHHQKHSRKLEQKSSTVSDSATKALEASAANQGDRFSSKSISDPSKSSDVATSFHPDTTRVDDNAKDTTTDSHISLVNDQRGEQVPVAMESKDDNNHVSSVPKDESQFLLAHPSGCKGSANDAGLSKTPSIQQTEKLNKTLEEAKEEPTKVGQEKVHTCQSSSGHTHIACEHPSPRRILQYFECDEDKQDYSASLRASGTSTGGKEDTRPDLQISSNLTYPDSGKEGGSTDEPSPNMENMKARTLGVFQRVLSIPTTVRRWNHKQKSRSMLRRASKSLSYRSTSLLSLRQFDDDLLEFDTHNDDDDNNDNPSRPCSLLERARSESVVGGEDPWFYNNATTAMNHDSIASMEMVFFLTDNDDDDEKTTE